MYSYRKNKRKTIKNIQYNKQYRLINDIIN